MKLTRYVYIKYDRAWYRMMCGCWPGCGLFRNREGVRPGRWGFYFGAFGLVVEVGSRNPGDKVGESLHEGWAKTLCFLFGHRWKVVYIDRYWGDSTICERCLTPIYSGAKGKHV